MKSNTLLMAVFLGLGLAVGCKKDDPEKEGPCGVKNPIQDLEWLRKDIELLSKPPILDYAYFTTKYKGERVFWLYFGGNSSFLTYRTCDGKFQYIPTPLPDDDETKNFIKLLRTPKMACPYIIWSTPYFQQLTNCLME